MRSWATRALTVYGDAPARPEELVDLHKRVTFASAKLETSQRPPRPRPAHSPTATVVEIESLTCESCGRTFERPRQRGRKPKHGPDCA